MIFSTLQKTNLQCAYSHFKDRIEPPYLVYLGRGQNTFGSDNTWTWRENHYQVEFYFKEKNEALETAIENVLLEDGYNYEKSDDVYIEDEGLFVIYYYI